MREKKDQKGCWWQMRARSYYLLLLLLLFRFWLIGIVRRVERLEVWRVMGIRCFGLKDSSGAL